MDLSLQSEVIETMQKGALEKLSGPITLKCSCLICTYIILKVWCMCVHNSKSVEGTAM